MNRNYYTFIGCSNAVEYFYSKHEKAASPDVIVAVQQLQSIREALLHSSAIGDPERSLKSALNSHVVSLLEAIETLRSSAEFASMDETLIDLLNHYYNISDEIMGGGGSISEDGERR